MVSELMTLCFNAAWFAGTNVLVLIGAGPDLGFLPEHVKARLPQHPELGLTKTNGESSSHPLHVHVDPATFQVLDAKNKTPISPSLYAMGPLRGDNFV